MKIMMLVLTMAAAVLAGCGGKTEEAAAEPRPVQPAAPAGRVSFSADSPKLREIRVEDVERAGVPSDEILSPGKVEANPNRLSHVALPVTGRVVAVRTSIGAAVREGDVLLTIESPDADMALAAALQADAAVTQAKAALIKADADLGRARDLFSHNAVAQKEVINAESSRAQAQAAVEQAQAGSEQTRRRLTLLGVKPGQFGQAVEVRAPISGKVLDISVVPGEFRNDASAPLMTIADLSSVWLTSDVPESSIRLVRAGEKLTVEFSAWPGELFTARVTRIADTVDPQTRTIKVQAELNNQAGRLRPEMFGRIRLSDRLREMPVIPAAAIVQDGARDVVFKQIEPGVFQQTAVTPGGRSGSKVAIVDGLVAGDRVVTDGVMLLKAN